MLALCFGSVFVGWKLYYILYGIPWLLDMRPKLSVLFVIPNLMGISALPSQFLFIHQKKKKSIFILHQRFFCFFNCAAINHTYTPISITRVVVLLYNHNIYYYSPKKKSIISATECASLCSYSECDILWTYALWKEIVQEGFFLLFFFFFFWKI